VNDLAEQRPVVVGIGASAGGLEALTRMLKGVPDDSGMAFVIIQHLDPAHSSAVVEMLARRTTLPIAEAAVADSASHGIASAGAAVGVPRAAAQQAESRGTSAVAMH
jgi:chemotaxis response regulator CheB